MNKLSYKILKDYQIRKTKKQKTAFIELLQKELPFDIQIEQVRSSRNIIVGDLEKAEIILGAHYDTAPELPFPNFLTPKNIWMLVLFNLLVVLLVVVWIQIVEILLSFFIDPPLSYSLACISSLFLCWYMLKGKANPHTANDNTSGVITLIEALYDENIRDKVACVFFDNEEIGLVGSKLFKKKHPEIKNKLLFNFDCVSDGDTIMLIYSKQASDVEDKLKQSFISEEKHFLVTPSSKTFYPSDQKNFSKSIGVAAFNKSWFGYYISRIHTRRDIIFDEKNIQVLVEGIKNYLERT